MSINYFSLINFYHILTQIDSRIPLLSALIEIRDVCSRLTSHDSRLFRIPIDHCQSSHTTYLNLQGFLAAEMNYVFTSGNYFLPV